MNRRSFFSALTAAGAAAATPAQTDNQLFDSIDRELLALQSLPTDDAERLRFYVKWGSNAPRVTFDRQSLRYFGSHGPVWNAPGKITKVLGCFKEITPPQAVENFRAYCQNRRRYIP